jgi:hypothetical protein
MDVRAALDAEDLLKIILVLVVVWIAVEIVGEVVTTLLGPFRPLFGLLIIVLIVLWLFDRI